MQVNWQGKDITSYVQVRKCVVRDACGGRCDSLDMTFDNAESWYRWGPEEDDKIRVFQDGYDSGEMFLNTICPEEGKYRIFATALPCKARKQEWKSFHGMTLEEILRSCALTSGMSYRLYGMDGGARIPYIQQENESAAAFLHRLMRLEGGVLKCVNGGFAGIGIDWAEEKKAAQEIRVIPDKARHEYRRNGRTIRSLTVFTPYAKATATDRNVPEDHEEVTKTEYPALGAIQAGRWARGLLRAANRECESLTVHGKFSPGWTAMCRIDVGGGTDADGSWIIEEVEHDLVARASEATLRRIRAAVW